jgi:hypothetical protein
VENDTGGQVVAVQIQSARPRKGLNYTSLASVDRMYGGIEIVTDCHEKPVIVTASSAGSPLLSRRAITAPNKSEQWARLRRR